MKYIYSLYDGNTLVNTIYADNIKVVHDYYKSCGYKNVTSRVTNKLQNGVLKGVIFGSLNNSSVERIATFIRSINVSLS